MIMLLQVLLHLLLLCPLQLLLCRICTKLRLLFLWCVTWLTCCCCYSGGGVLLLLLLLLVILLPACFLGNPKFSP
jgi:hypothetical protein